MSRLRARTVPLGDFLRESSADILGLESCLESLLEEDQL